MKHQTISKLSKPDAQKLRFRFPGATHRRPLHPTLSTMNYYTGYLLCTLLLVGPVHASPPKHVSLMQIQTELQATAPRAVLMKYYDTPAWSNSIMPGIRSASPNWLAIAEQLSLESDAAASEDLDIALYDALAIAPYRVLPVLSRRSGESEDKICNVFFESDVPKQGVKVYLQSIRIKLANPKNARQKKAANACLRGLAQSQKAATAQGLK